ncbi:DsbA family protein [Mesobacillus jeotgali]|uniref:DsbA family protein n=1 Tax=Mesobacillus jeotgali TaxID=129985 RepID=UPI00177C2891|nr:thioredoxin domain-containing protein [Mesobacillus jeotgali]UYZ21587.1 DsbA family protein [Mesobacillus jeotgali]
MVPKNNSFFKMAVIITLVVVVALAALVMINSKSETNPDTTTDKLPPIEGQPTLGVADAPVTVVEFGDYKCPACKAWGEQFFPTLIKDYIDQGKVKFVYINVLFHGEESKVGSAAAEAVYKQSPEGYWQFHKQLFSEQPGADHDSNWLTEEKALEVASTVPGIDLAVLEKDMRSQEIKEELDKDTALVEEFKVEKTPTIMVNDTILEDPFDYELIISLIEEGLKEKQ